MSTFTDFRATTILIRFVQALDSEPGGGRRARLLAARLRFDGVKVENVEEALRKSELRDPYDGSPFNWSTAENSIVFRQELAGKPDLKLVY